MADQTCECGAPGYVRSATYDLPLCEGCWQTRRARGLEGEPDPELVVPAVPPGSLSWDYRPPERVGREGCDLEIVVDGRVLYQQRPPTHVAGSRGRSAVVRVVRREVTEAEAERLSREFERLLAAGGCTEAEGEALRLQRQGLTRGEIAARLGIGLSSTRRRLERGRRRLRAVGQ